MGGRKFDSAGEDIRAGKKISGSSPVGAAVEVWSVEWYRDAAVRVVYKD
jgi:hypothetical protein